MENQKDNVSKLYQGLLKNGYTQNELGDEVKFRQRMSDVDNRKMFYDYAKSRGDSLIGDYDTYLSRLNEAYANTQSDDDAVFEANAERFRNGQPTERVTTQSMIDAHPELGLQQPEQKRTAEQYTIENRPEMFGKRNASLLDLPLNLRGEEPEPLYQPQSINNTLNNAYGTANDYAERVNARAEIAERNLKDPMVQKGRTEADMRGLASEIDGLLEEESKNEQNTFSGSAFMPAGARGRSYNESNKERVDNVSNLWAAKRLLEQSNYIVEAAKRGDTGILSDTWQGFKDSLEAEDFTFGLADAASSAAILDAIKKVEKGEQLTESEDKLLRASAINMAVQYNFANDLGRAYKAGGTFGESVPFMLEMAINPISSFGNASAKTLLNYGLKSFAKQVGKGLARGVAAGTGMALTTGAGRVAAGTTDRLASNYNYGVDFDGNLYAEKKDNPMGVGEAFARSLASTAIENQSEMIFNAFKPIGGFMKGVQDVLPGGVNKFFDMLSHNKVADAYRWLKKSPVFRNYLVKDVRNATQIGGIFEEYAEEVYNNLANFAIGEMSWDDVVSLDKNIDTFLGLAPTQAMFGLLGLGGAGAMRYQTRRTLEDLQATMNEQQRKQLEGLLDMGLDAEEVDVRGFIRNVMQNENYTIDNKRDMIKAAFYVAKQKGIDQLTEADVIDKVIAENSLIDSVTDPSTGVYAEITAKLPDAKEGTIEVPGNVVGWFGEGEKRQPIFVAEGMENTEENRRVLKPGEWDASSVQEMPAEQVKTVNEEMIREEAAQQAENEARWNPNVPEPQEGISFFNGDEEVTIVGTDGNGGLFVAPSEEYRAAQGNEKKVAEVVNRAMQLGAIPIEQYKDAMTAQIEAEEKAAQYNKPITNEDSVVRNGKTYTVTGVDADGVQYMDETGTPNKVPTNIWKSWAYDQEQAMNPNSTSGESVDEQVNSEVNAEVNNPETSGESVSSVEVAQQPQVEAQQEPTLESVVAALPKTKKGEIDYGAMTPQQQYQYTSLSESPEVALEDLQADIAANEEELVKMKDELGKARGGKRAELRDKVKKLASANEELKAFYESVAPKQDPIAETENTESADPIKYAAEEVAEESKPIVAETEKPKKARKPKLTGRKKPQKPSEFTDEELRPANGVELAAEQLAAGNIKITVESYKKETGHGEEERKKMGLTPFRSTEKGGMTIEQAAEKLVEEDNANHNGRMFDGDTMSARDAIIELFGMSEKWSDVTNYIKNNRMVERQKREEAEYAEYEAYLMESLHVTPEELELLNEAEEQRIIELNKVVNEVDAIFAEAELERQNNEEYEQGRIVEGSQGQSELLSEARAGDLGGNQRNESERGTGEVVGTSDNNSETSQESAPGSEVAPSIEETNVGRMADIEARILEIEGRRNEISDEIADTPSYDLLKIGELRAEEWELEQEQAELEAEYSGLRAMNDESNAISEAEGSGLRFRESAKEEENRRKPLRDRAKQWSDKLGVKVRIMESFGDVVNPYARRAIASGQVVTGWFEESTGEVCIYMPHVNSESEVDATYIHEVVAHKGLRGLLGEKFDSFCDEVWDMMSDADRLKFMSYPGVSHLEGKEKSRAAADEYIAHLAENIDVTESAWSKFAELVKKFLKAIGIEPKMTNADIANTIKKSYQRLLSGENAEGNVRGEGTRFRFIGERGARNLDKAEEATTRLDNLSVAREMESAEKDAKSIKMATGWERGADGKWRYEVDDDIDFELRRPRKAELKKAYDEANEKYYKLEMRVPVRTPKNATEEEKQRIKDLRKELAKLRKAMNKAFEAYYDYSADNAKLGDFLGKDNQLFKEYPELADYDISFLRDTSKLSQGLKGSFTPEYKTIWIDDARPKGDIKSSLIHEIQHAIQGIEGFAQGGTPQMFAVAKYHAEDSKTNFKEFINRYGFEDWEKNLPFEDLMAYGKQYKGEFGALHRAFIENAVEDESVKKTLLNELDYVKDTYNKFYQIAGGMDAAYKFKDANEWYRSLSGEVEARNVQQRMGMTDEQRGNSLASETEDVAREDQIFLNGALVEGTRFRLSDKGRKIQNEVDKFTAKYNSKEVVVAEVSSMTDEEIEEMFNAPADEVREAMGKNLVGGYDKLSGKIFIFVDNQDLDDLEDTMYHENMHGFFHGNKMIGAFDEAVKDNTKKLRANLKGRGYSEEEIPEEVFVIIVTNALKKQDFKNIDKYLPEEYKEDFYNKLTDFGYETGKRVSGQRSDGRGNDSENGPNGEEPRSLAETDGTQGTKRTSPREQAERLGTLFGQVADMGLDGVLGNKEYTRLMVDIYKELPEDVRTSLADDALRHYGGSIAPAVSDYVNKKGKASLWDKIAGFIREALRKVGIDLELNGNDAKYILWRSRKPLDRNNLLDVAEDIDMRYRLNVGEFKDSPTDGGGTPGDGGTRFKVKGKAKTKAELKEEVSDLKEEVKDLKSELKDLKKQVDSLRSGNKDEWEKKQRAIVSFIKGRLTKEAGSVLGKTRLDQLLTLVNKASTSTDLRKPLQFIEQVINDASIEHAASKMDKLIKTKLQGETNRGVAKGVVVDESTRRLFDSIRGTFKGLIATSIDSELRSVRGEILRFGKERNALPEDDLQGRAILQARQDALKQRKEELEKEQEELQRQNVNETKESLERRHDELVEAMDAHIEGNGVWTQEMQDEYDSIPLRLKLAEIRESQSQLDSILVDSLMTRRNAYKTTGAERKKLLAEADVLESNYTIAQEELIRLMNEVSSELSSIINEGKSRLATRRQALAERRRHIVTMGISAVKDKKIKEQNSILTRKEKFDKWFDNSWLKSVSDFMTAPLNSFNFMLKYIDRNHTIGEGELYKHFMKSEEGALEANNRLYDGLKAYNTAIEEKAKEIFGKDIEKVMKDSGEQHVGKVHKQYLYDSSDHKEGDMYPISISKGQAFYVWLTWRQEDGRAKLIADGWNDQSIEEIESLIGEDYMKFGEWITDDFFPNLREEKYNKTHIEMFGTSMAKREHYFPFKISSSDIQEKGEMGESYEGMPSTITGNIIKRTINKSRINTEQNAFDLLYKYGNDMETWNAMAKLRQDLNFLHASKAFRNYLEANSKGLFDKFMKAAEVAVKAYNNSGESNAINDFLVKINRMWAGSNIGFRLNTAMKQILSYPAFMAYSANPKYLGNLAKYMMNWKGNYDWAKENLPAFRQRIETGDLGMTGMSDPQFDLGKHIKKFTDAGMIPNQLVDALTCAAGARSVYEFEYDKAIKNGLTEEEAKNIAQYNAEVAFNETQQSSREEFVSPIQMSRNVLLKSMMNYQNSNVGYQRLGNEGLLEIMRAKHVYEQDVKNGMSKEEAQAKLRKSIVRGSRKMMVAFTILPGLWYLGSQGIVGITSPVISSLFGGGGDDEPYLDEEAKTELLWSMALGTVAGTTLGQTIASIAQGREYNPMVWMNEMQKDIKDAVKNGWNLNTTKNIALRLAKFGGVNVETWENIYLGVEHAIRTGNPDLVDFMMLINLPASQRKAMAEELYSNMPFMEYAEKVARAHKLYDDYRKNLPYAKSDKNGSKKNAIKKQYVIENLSEEKQEDYEKEKEYKKLKREYGQSENKDEWLEEHPEYKELEKEYKSQTVTKEVNREVKKLK